MLALAVIGWLAAVILAGMLLRHRCAPPPARSITHLLMVDAKGWPESLRAARTGVPKELTRVHGKHTATTRYARTGTAAVYQVKG